MDSVDLTDDAIVDVSKTKHLKYFKYCLTTIDHFTVVGLVNGSEVGVDLVLIRTSLLLLCKSSCSNAN